MKRKSIVWQFYDKVIEDRRTKAVVCRLCDSEYKFLGNTTNLKSHLTRKHPLQWELVASQTEVDDEDSKRPRYTYIYENDTEVEPEDGTVDQDDGDESRRGHEEWLEEDPFEQKSKRRRRIKSERGVTPVLQFEDLPERLVLEGGSHSATAPRDQYDAFGDYVARRLRNLKSQNTRSNVQQLMTTMLWQAEFGAYEEQKSAAEAHRILTETYSDDALSDTTCRDWFRCFENNEFELENKKRSGVLKQIEDEKLEELLNQDRYHTLSELGKTLQDSVKKALLAMVVDRPVVSYTAQVVLEDHAQPEPENGHDLKEDKGT
ncbi:Mariner Mos1 transposase [Eumeta japonica]|uniref:Mariner Mos1 transposase n=1 Tax=Eumeta variegata TaxID=151549 RepID=A0A4C1T6X9_EUMVA|nr:Mariner Mos1 transposase [Eumeta japonica]